jgi:predicted transcriptional regulator
MGPQRSDILISIHPIHIRNIVSRLKTHEFRKYLIPASVKRMWFYTTSPTQKLQYVAVIGRAKRAGDIEETSVLENGHDTRNKSFNYGYEILSLYELKEPLSLQKLMDKKWVKKPPQKYLWVKEEMLKRIPIDEQIKLF